MTWTGTRRGPPGLRVGKVVTGGGHDARVVMSAAKLVLEPIFEADFLPVSFGFRPKRSTHDALEVVRVEANRGRDWVLDADVSDCLGAWSHCSFR